MTDGVTIDLPLSIQDAFLAAIALDPEVDAPLCAGLPPELWFQTREKGRSNVGHDAKKICAACPVAGECLTGAIARREPFGIWGGQGGKNLRSLRRSYETDRDCDGYGWKDDCRCGWCDALTSAINFDGTVLDANGDEARHGTPSRYAKGCRCIPCEFINGVYATQQQLREKTAA